VIDMIQNLSPVLLGIIVAALVWFMRAQAAGRSRICVRQLDQAAELLLLHNGAMERFLDDQDAPIDLKSRVISFSDAMTDRGMVKTMAHWLSSRPLGRPPKTEEVRSIEDQLTALGVRRPDLVEGFAVAILTAVVGAAMRWPDSAALIEQAFPRLVATPQRDIAVVATASIMRPVLAFARNPTAAAAA
jgi:hypothetical protein